MPDDWQILRGEKRCATCGKEFQEEETHYSALYDRRTEFERLDFCTACWNGETPEMFSFWQTRVPPKEQKRRLLVDDDVLLDFFRRLQGATDELKTNFRYILALVLMRRKILKFSDVKRINGQEFLVLQLRKERQTFEVLNPQLDEEKIARVTDEVGKILNVQL
ncbi:MAG: hypothetical protein AMK75_02355 [Planctomycetes bacterium SM23_65]|nr:MAG: hypothetical protein AMK75_02355 [Planctomycetes bacterium SM23_65]